jgi:hypothetical protein
MKTVRRLLYRDIVASVLFIALAFLSLFFFIDFVDELGGVGVRGRTAWHAVWAAALQVPGHLYESWHPLRCSSAPSIRWLVWLSRLSSRSCAQVAWAQGAPWVC